LSLNIYDRKDRETKRGGVLDFFGQKVIHFSTLCQGWGRVVKLVCGENGFGKFFLLDLIFKLKIRRRGREKDGG